VFSVTPFFLERGHYEVVNGLYSEQIEVKFQMKSELIMRVQEFYKEINCKKVYSTISFASFIFMIDISIFEILKYFELKQYWLLLPLSIYVLGSILAKHVKIVRIVIGSLEISSILSFVLLYIGIRNEYIAELLKKHFEIIAVTVILALFINLYICRNYTPRDADTKSEPNSLQLFNLFYLNTSKAHEIAMLIDNKIMKTIEREQVSEELLKYNASSTLGLKDVVATDVGYSMEDNSKKRVYENFDVKTTKSIMLRTIYETAQKKGGSTDSLKIGDLVLFKSIELQQRNIEDTVMILNILQDSKIKNQSNDAIEINVSKMMDKMLDDFTIDYTFEYTCESTRENPSTFIIQIPYKATDNFENGYQHNDLQLGRLSLIGIYRGKIDFSKRESISSKFLEMISASYNQANRSKVKPVEMKLSSGGTTSNDIQIEFHHEKLTDEMHLVDVIAIIQELNFDRDE